jgi:epoxyqueuosine reductase
MRDLTAALKAQAKEVGFDLVGVCDARPFVREREFLEGRQPRGIEPNPFEYPDVESRTDPQAVLPGVKSIVAVGMSYQMPDSPLSSASMLKGWFSRYCRGLDYHAVLGDRMVSLAAWLQDQAPGARAVVHVDTGAPLDRAIAERAGLGRFGKSTLLIARGFGTWTFLGEIFTTLRLIPDEAADWNVCGTCTRCIDACPTACLTPWQIDSNRCLGFLNQKSGEIPREFREVMGDRLFGCDDCQDVCPYNRTAARGLHPEFAAQPSIDPGPDLIPLLEMDQTEFETTIGPTAAAWRGLKTLQRNALVALGNSGTPEAMSPLVDHLAHPSPRLRLHAAWAISRLATRFPSLASVARNALSQRLTEEQDQDVLAELQLARADISTLV